MFHKDEMIKVYTPFELCQSFLIYKLASGSLDLMSRKGSRTIERIVKKAEIF